MRPATSTSRTWSISLRARGMSWLASAAPTCRSSRRAWPRDDQEAGARNRDRSDEADRGGVALRTARAIGAQPAVRVRVDDGGQPDQPRATETQAGAGGTRGTLGLGLELENDNHGCAIG